MISCAGPLQSKKINWCVLEERGVYRDYTVQLKVTRSHCMTDSLFWIGYVAIGFITCQLAAPSSFSNQCLPPAETLSLQRPF